MSAHSPQRAARRWIALASVALVAAVAASGAHAQKISKQDKKAAEKLFSGKLYLRIDAPCETGRQPFGIYHSPLVDVSPEGASTDTGSGTTFGWWHAQSTDWSARINDEMTLDEIDWDEEPTLELQLEGAGKSEGHDTAIRFVKIQSLADFQAAFDKTFSRVPLQEEHADWSAEIKQAIADRKLLQGMTKRQAYYIVGTPSKVEKETKDSKEIETWTLQAQGLQVGFWGVSGSNQAPQTIRFENNALVDVGSSTTQLDLDD